MKMRPVLSAVVVSALLAANAKAEDPRVIRSMSDRYADNGAKPGKGRAGSAAIEARVLINKDGSADLDVTTGVLDSTATATGKMSKVQLKLLNAAGDAIATQVINGLDTTLYRQVLTGMTRGQQLQIQANVRGADPKRTGVVTVQTAAVRRPDPSVLRLQLPAQVNPGREITISADLGELNHDVSVAAQCVLEIDGVEAQRLPVWIDAGDVVSCEFRKAFDALGRRQVTVKVDSAKPADFDLTNNAKSAEIEVGAPNSMTSYANINIYKGTQHQTINQRITLGDGTILKALAADSTWSYDTTSFYVTGWIQARKNVNGSSFAVSLASGAESPITFVKTFGAPQYTWGNTWGSYSDEGECANEYVTIPFGPDTWGIAASSICSGSYSYDATNRYGWTSASVWKNGGTVTYAANNSCSGVASYCWWGEQLVGEVTADQGPNFLTQAASYTVNATLTADGESYHAQHNISAQTYSGSDAQPESCWSYVSWWDSTTNVGCASWSQSYTYTWGYSSISAP